ncbi:VOC family protein [Nakamurella silvestris]|nr:VOC family protein [Nakamurella silvestris]
MSHQMQVVIDAASPAVLGEFWSVALGYRMDDPPPGFDTWEEALLAGNIPKEQWDDAYAIVDPEDRGPRVFFQKVPEGKTVKNRVHLDVRAADGPRDPDRWDKIQALVERLVGVGGAVVAERRDDWGGHWMVMTDPEGNEFCVS